MGPVSYLSRLAGDGGKRAFLNPPRVLFRPVLPTNPGLPEIERTTSWPEQTPSISVADRGVPMKPSPAASIKLPGLPTSGSQPVALDQAPHLLIQQAPPPVSQLPGRVSNRVRMEPLLSNPKDAEPAIMPLTHSGSRQSSRTDSPNLEPVPGATGIVNEVNRSSTGSARASDSMIDKTIGTEQTGIVYGRSVVSRPESQRQAITAIEDTTALTQEGVRQKQTSSVSSASEAVHSHRVFLAPPTPAISEKSPAISERSTHRSEKSEQRGADSSPAIHIGSSASEAARPRRIFLTPPAPAIPEKSTHRFEKREQRGSGSSPAIHIGTLEVRINPLEPPREVISSTTSTPRTAAPLAQGFRSFGLAQG